jgi:hypothetical protein
VPPCFAGSEVLQHCYENTRSSTRTNTLPVERKSGRVMLTVSPDMLDEVELGCSDEEVEEMD